MATKQISRQNSINSDKKDLSPHLLCGEISPHDRFYSTFLHMTWFSYYLPCGDISPNDSLSYGKKIPHDRFFSTSTECGACDKYEVSKWISKELFDKQITRHCVFKWLSIMNCNKKRGNILNITLLTTHNIVIKEQRDTNHCNALAGNGNGGQASRN